MNVVLREASRKERLLVVTLIMAFNLNSERV
jgi:hypothetical protein